MPLLRVMNIVMRSQTPPPDSKGTGPPPPLSLESFATEVLYKVPGGGTFNYTGPRRQSHLAEARWEATSRGARPGQAMTYGPGPHAYCPPPREGTVSFLEGVQGREVGQTIKGKAGEEGSSLAGRRQREKRERWLVERVQAHLL